MTGEFFADAITLPDGVAIEDIKDSLRKLSTMKSCAIFSTARCAGVLPEYIFSPGLRSSKSSTVVTFSGA